MRRVYVPLATATLARPVLTVVIAGFSIVVALLWIPRLGVQFFPSADRNQFFIAVNAPEGDAKRELAHGVSMERALISAGTKRLRPIMLTVTASIAGLIPLAVSSQTLWRPFCWAVTFGLGCSMVMTLVAIPALYRLVGSRQTANEPPTSRREELSSREFVLPEPHPR